MGTILVAYGEPAYRETVLAFAAERAAASGDDLLVYHVAESPEESPDAVRGEVAAVMDRTAPDVSFEVRIEARGEASDRTNVSKQKRLIDTILEGGEFVYVVMGNVERGPIEELTLASMTESVLETRAVPVTLVPVE